MARGNLDAVLYIHYIYIYIIGLDLRSYIAFTYTVAMVGKATMK